MSTMLLDDYDGEADFDAEAEDYEAEDYDGEGEGEDFESSRSRALRRQRAARARRIRAAQQRSAQARRGAVPSAPAAPVTPRQTVAAIRNLDLENKVGEDALRSQIARVNRRAARATYATVAGVALDQAFDTFEADLDGHDFIRAGLRLSPLLLLAPARRRPGVEGVLLDPRVIGATAVAGLLAVGQFRERDEDVERIDIFSSAIDSGTQEGDLLAIAVNKKGADTGREITWTPVTLGGFTLDRNGRFRNSTPVTQRTPVRVTATAGGVPRTFFLVLEPPADSSGDGTAPKKVTGGTA